MRESPAPSEVLKVFHDNPGKTFRLRELVVELGLRSSQARELKRVLKDLARNRRIILGSPKVPLAGRHIRAQARGPRLHMRPRDLHPAGVTRSRAGSSGTAMGTALWFRSSPGEESIRISSYPPPA